jgi:hypothetical protein
MTSTQTVGSTRELVARIRGEFQEMPGLRLTLRQATRLFGLDAGACEHALTTLVERKFLRVTRDGAFVRTADSPHH